MRISTCCCSALVLLALTLSSGLAEAQHASSLGVPDSESEVRWNPRWSKFGLENYITTGSAIGVAFATLAIPPVEDRWRTENDFDNEMRSALRSDTLIGRNHARDASDVLLTVSINQLLLDTLVVSWWAHDQLEVATQMALIDVETIAINSAINGLVASIASRERPYRDQCVGDNATELLDCRSSKRYRSYYSGHTSTAFAVAGLTCMHHYHLPLYGGGAPDALVCAGSYLAAGATGLMRIVADQHWTSDVVTGAALGTATGLLVPYMMHYRTGDMPAVAELSALNLRLAPTPSGAYLLGQF